MSKLHYRTLRENIVDEIRMRIVNQEIKPGSRIIEQELAEEFHTSRAPIREALRQLENEGLIEYTRNVGCSVKEISTWEAYEIYLMRTNYETMAVKLMSGKIPEDTITNMETILEKMKQVDLDHYKEVFINDNEIHGELIRMTNLPRLYKAWAELNYGNVITSRSKNMDKQKVIDRQYCRHKELVELCKRGDCEEICYWLADHYMNTIRRMLEEQEVHADERYSLDFLIK